MDQTDQTTATEATPQTPTQTIEEIRDWAEVRKIIAQRDELKSEIGELRAMITNLSKPAAPQAKGPEDDIAGVKAEIEALKAARAHELKAQRRSQVEQSVLGQASEQSREHVRLLLAGLHTDGAINLYAEDPAAEAHKAATKLRQSMPALFAQPTHASPAPAGRHELVPDIPLHDLTKEQLSLLSKEEFSKRRRAARTSGLAV